MNAVIYARYSSDNQREESIEGQLRECLSYAEKRYLLFSCPQAAAPWVRKRIIRSLPKGFCIFPCFFLRSMVE